MTSPKENQLPPNLPPTATIRPIRLDKVRLKTGLSRSTIYNLIQQGGFPAQIPYTIGPRSRAVFWDETHIEAWLEDQLIRAKEKNLAKAAHQQKLQKGRRLFQDKRKERTQAEGAGKSESVAKI